jgi:MoaA/NifB/PqqE/SkfB family radical SAM enzyme
VRGIKYPPIRDIERHVLESAGKLSAPLTLFLEITDACNQNCLFCIQPGKRQIETHESRHMSLEHIEKILHESKTLGAPELYISGGEPTCHPQFLEIMTRVKKFQFRVTILTNGVNFSSTAIKTLSSILEPERDLLLLGLDAADRAAYRNLRGQDHFGLLLETLEMLRDAALPFATQAVIVKSNIAHLEDAWKLSSGYGAKAHILILPYRKKEMAAGFYPSDEEIRLALERLSNGTMPLGKNRTPLIFPGDPGNKHHGAAHLHCPAGYTSCAVSARGEVHICAFALDRGLSVGNLFRTSLGETWQSIGQFMKKNVDVNPTRQGSGCPFING